MPARKSKLFSYVAYTMVGTPGIFPRGDVRVQTEERSGPASADELIMMSTDLTRAKH